MLLYINATVQLAIFHRSMKFNICIWKCKVINIFNWNYSKTVGSKVIGNTWHHFQVMEELLP